MKNKVIEFVIEPLVDWFDKDISDGQIKVYGEVLGNYSAETLQTAMKDLKSTWMSKFMPLPANIRALCDYYLPKTKPLTIYEKTNLNFWEAASRIMSTEIGKLALKECWARSLICEVMTSGKMVFNETDIEIFRKGRKKAEQAMHDYKSTDFGYKEILNLWQTMQNKEQQLIDKYNLG